MLLGCISRQARIIDTAHRPAPGCRFFMYWALLFLCHQFGLSLYRFMSTLARNIVVANAAGMMVLLCVFLMNGFVIQRRYLHPWVLWSTSLLSDCKAINSTCVSVSIMIMDVQLKVLCASPLCAALHALLHLCHSSKALQGCKSIAAMQHMPTCCLISLLTCCIGRGMCRYLRLVTLMWRDIAKMAEWLYDMQDLLDESSQLHPACNANQ